MSEPQKLVPGGQSLVGGGQWSAAPPPVPDRPDTLTGLPVPGYLRQLMGETVGRAAAGIGQGADVANQGLWALANLPPAVMARLGGNPPPAPGPMPESLAALIRKKFGIVPQEELGTLQERIGALAWEGLGPAVLAAGAGQVARSVARGWGAPAAGDNFLWTNKHSVFEGEPATRFEVMHAGGQDTEFLNVRQQPDGRWAVVDQQHRVLSEHPTDVAAGQAAERVLPQMFPQPGARGASRDPLERAVAWARSLGERGSAGEQRTLPGMPEPAPKVGPLWRDNILDALEQAPQEKMTPAQLQAHLGKYRGTKDQADWIGLSDFLEGKKSVTRAEVRQFVEENPLRVEERVLGQELPISYERFRQKYGYNDTPQARREYESDLANGVLASKGTKYDQYQTPGGENYR